LDHLLLASWSAADAVEAVVSLERAPGLSEDLRELAGFVEERGDSRLLSARVVGEVLEPVDRLVGFLEGNAELGLELAP